MDADTKLTPTSGSSGVAALVTEPVKKQARRLNDKGTKRLRGAACSLRIYG
jgi:hypothetical protein